VRGPAGVNCVTLYCAASRRSVRDKSRRSPPFAAPGGTP